MPDSELDPHIICVALGRDPGATIDAMRDAFTQLYMRYEQRVRSAVARAAMKAAYKHRVDDLRQEVWCRFARPKGSVLGYYDARRGAFGPFITRLAYQQALAAIHRERRHQGDTAQADTYEDEAEDPEMTRIFVEVIQTDFYDKLMERAEQELDAEELAMLRDIYFHDQSCLAVASLHGINKNTIYKRHQRIKDKLRGWAEELLAQSGDQRHPPATVAAIIALLAASLITPAMDGTLSSFEPPTRGDLDH